MKKAAEVDFTWAAFAEPMKTEVLAKASRVRVDAPGKRLENLGHRHAYRSRAFCTAIMIVLTAKQTSALGQRRTRRGPFRGGWILTNEHHDDVTLSLRSLTVKNFFLESRKGAWRLTRAAQHRSARVVEAQSQRSTHGDRGLPRQRVRSVERKGNWLKIRWPSPM
jgi:hypothetical protein